MTQNYLYFKFSIELVAEFFVNLKIQKILFKKKRVKLRK